MQSSSLSSLNRNNQFLHTFAGEYCELFANLSVSRIHELSKFYSDNVEFIDPFQRVCGFSAFETAMEKAYADISNYNVVFDDVSIVDNKVYLNWKMLFSHPKIQNGRITQAYGVTYLIVDSKIIYHRDFYDAGEMIYQHIPVLGRVIKRINSKMSH